MKTRQLEAHMRAAYVYANLSYCERKKVGCVIIEHDPDDGDRIISIGYNGTPPGDCNCCEDTIVGADGVVTTRTKDKVIHAEDNAIRKLKKANIVATPRMSLFVTIAPCTGCAEKIVSFGIKTVYYHDAYNNEFGLNHLKANGVSVHQITP